VIAKLLRQRRLARARLVHPQVQGQQRDRHGEDAVAERLQPARVHAIPFRRTAMLPVVAGDGGGGGGKAGLAPVRGCLVRA
jgi:hypothetical protein